MAHILHGLEIGGVHYRIVKNECWFTIEQRNKDSLGDVRWDVVDRYNFDAHTSEKNAAANRPLAVMLLTIVQQSERIEDFREAAICRSMAV